MKKGYIYECKKDNVSLWGVSSGITWVARLKIGERILVVQDAGIVDVLVEYRGKLGEISRRDYVFFKEIA